MKPGFVEVCQFAIYSFGAITDDSYLYEKPAIYET